MSDVTDFDFLDPLVFLEWLKLDTLAHAVRVVHSMQSLPNYFGFMFVFWHTL